MNQDNNNLNQSNYNINNSKQNGVQSYNCLNYQSNNNISKGENNSKFKKITKKIFIVLTIIAASIGCGFSVFSIFTAFTMKGIEFFGPLSNILAFWGGIVFLIYTVVIIAIIWIVYGIINLLYNIYNKLNAKHKKIFKIVLISLFLIIIIYFISCVKINQS